jgi:hypothetical protein
MSIKIKHGHMVEFYEGRTLLRDESGEEVMFRSETFSRPFERFGEGRWITGA